MALQFIMYLYLTVSLHANIITPHNIIRAAQRAWNRSHKTYRIQGNKTHPAEELKQHYATFCAFWGMFFMSNYFWYHLQMHFDGIWWCEGQINTPVVPTSHLGYALCSWNSPQTWKKSLHTTASPTLSPKDPSKHVTKVSSVPTVLLVMSVRWLHAL